MLYLRSIDRLTMITPQEIDQLINELDGNVMKNSSMMFILSTSTTDRKLGILSVYNKKKDNITHLNDSNFTAAITFDELTTEQIQVMIIDEPIPFRNLNPSVDQYLVSSIIIASVTKRNRQSQIKVTLYFRILPGRTLNKSGDYLCSFLDTKTSTWSKSGCSTTQFGSLNEFYQCTCNHLSIFALIWYPKRSQSDTLDHHEIASLVFLTLSILAFIAVITHVLFIQLNKSVIRFRACELLPLVSSAATTIIFIFYIALSMTVYAGTSSRVSVLMFFVYFLIIFMFCIKTSVGFFNYLRFVYLFPEPSFRKLYTFLVISFVISIGWTSFAVAVNANPSFNITQFHRNKIYWFTEKAIYCFMMIPVGIFLVINVVMMILVARRIIEHVHRAKSAHGLYERRKRCILVLLSSCITQGVGWFFGPFLSLMSPSSSGKVFAWFFDLFNGLEGVWTLLIYIIIRSQRIDESRQVSDKKKHLKKIAPVIIEKLYDDLYDEQSVELGATSVDIGTK